MNADVLLQVDRVKKYFQVDRQRPVKAVDRLSLIHI